MLDKTVLRWGGMAAMVGSVLGVIFNLLHPRSTAAASDAMNELHLVAASNTWVFVHFMLAWALAFSLIGLVAIGWSFADGPASAWGRFATASAIVGIGVAFVTILVDGPAMKHVADNMMATGMGGSGMAQDPSLAVTEITFALFTGTIGSLFGLTPVLYGVAALNDDSYPEALGYVAIMAGVLGLLTGSIQYLNGIAPLTANILFPIASLIFTVWIFIAGYRLWKPAAAPAGQAAVS
jgi:hypothetical protein